jgi:hypothetical protein
MVALWLLHAQHPCGPTRRELHSSTANINMIVTMYASTSRLNTYLQSMLAHDSHTPKTWPAASVFHLLHECHSHFPVLHRATLLFLQA